MSGERSVALNNEPMEELFGELEDMVAEGVAMSLFNGGRALEIARWLDRCVDGLVPGVHVQPTPYAREMYVDLMMGLAMMAESLRARSQSDLTGADQDEATASRCFERVRFDELAFEDDFRLPDGGMW